LTPPAGLAVVPHGTLTLSLRILIGGVAPSIAANCATASGIGRTLRAVASGQRASEALQGKCIASKGRGSGAPQQARAPHARQSGLPLAPTPPP